jgi:hypothetical protein
VIKAKVREKVAQVSRSYKVAITLSYIYTGDVTRCL